MLKSTHFMFLSLLFSTTDIMLFILLLYIYHFLEDVICITILSFFFYLQVDHRSEKTDQNKSGSNYVPDNDLDPQEESTDADGGFVQLPAVCQSKSIDYDYADDNSDSDYVPVCIQCLAIFCVDVVFLCNF